MSETLSYYAFLSGFVLTAIAALARLVGAMSSITIYRQAATNAGNVSVSLAVPFVPSPGLLGLARVSLYASLALLTLSLIFRAVAVERPPVGNLWEYTIALSWGIVLFTVAFETAFKERSLSLVMLPVAVTMMTVALAFFPSGVRPLVPALQANRILGLHVTTMMLAYSALSISFGASVLYLLRSPSTPQAGPPASQGQPASTSAPDIGQVSSLGIAISRPASGMSRAERDGIAALATRPELIAVPGGLGENDTPVLSPAPVEPTRSATADRVNEPHPSRLPDLETLGEIAYWSVLIGFPLLTLGIALGAYWANTAWGRYWGWDPKETAALLTWFVYAGYLHARGLRGWEGRRAAWLLVLAFGAVLFTYFAVNFLLKGLHSYAGV